MLVTVLGYFVYLCYFMYIYICLNIIVRFKYDIVIHVMIVFFFSLFKSNLGLQFLTTLQTSPSLKNIANNTLC